MKSLKFWEGEWPLFTKLVIHSQFVAIKTLKPTYVNQETFVDRFKREAKMAANLNHPNIVQIFDWGIEDEPYFVMEYIEGNTLTSIIAKNRTISLSDILFIGAQVSSGLLCTSKRCIHEILNRKYNDNSRRKSKSYRFWYCFTSKWWHYQNGSILELQAIFRPNKPRKLFQLTDLYSLGTVLYELITGKAPFSGDSPISTATKHLTENQKNHLYSEDLPKGVESAILKLLEKATYDRFKSTEDLKQYYFSKEKHYSLSKQEKT